MHSHTHTHTGYPADGALALSYSHFGEGRGPIVLDDVNCEGLELYITDCPNAGLYNHNCGHSEDAGVRCPSESRLVYWEYTE